MGARSTLAAERYRLLLAQLRAEFVEANDGKDHGWREWAAQKLDISGAHVSALTAETRNAGGHLVDRAIRSAGIRAEFFHDAKIKAPHFRDYIGAASRVERIDAINGDDEHALRVFLGSGSHAPVYAAEIDQLRGWSRTSHRKGRLTPADYAESLELLRRSRTNHNESKGSR